MTLTTESAVKHAASITNLRDFGELLANPERIDAIVPSGNLIDGEPVAEHSVAFVHRSGRVITIVGEDSWPLWNACKRGCER